MVSTGAGSAVDVVIVGAGLAGLCCAQDLTRAGIECRILESSDGVGGRVRTDQVDGFRLDRGFQILLTAYPEVRHRLDLAALQLATFEPGAVIRVDGGFHRVADPLRRPLLVAATLRAPVGSLADKVRLARLVLDVRTRRVGDLLRRPETTTAVRLSRAGFSDRMVETFWRPLFSGIQLDPDLDVSSRRFDVILRMLATGATAVPRRGMGAVPVQVAGTLPEGCVHLGTRVTGVAPVGSCSRAESGWRPVPWWWPPTDPPPTAWWQDGWPTRDRGRRHAAGSPAPGRPSGAPSWCWTASRAVRPGTWSS